MNSKLFVGGLDWETNDNSLRQAFEEYGPVQEAVVITDRYTGRSRGFGFVTFDHSGDAMEAKVDMDGEALDGRRVNVEIAKER